jgi:hypothetical protein
MTGDKDFIPAMVKTRQLGKRVVLASMRSSCALDLVREDLPTKDFKIVWLDDHLDEIMVPRPQEDLFVVPMTVASTPNDAVPKAISVEGVNNAARIELEHKKEELANKTVVRLREECKAMGLRSTGVKKELIERLEEALDKAISEVPLVSAEVSTDATVIAAALTPSVHMDAMEDDTSRIRRKDDYFFNHVLPSALLTPLVTNGETVSQGAQGTTAHMNQPQYHRKRLTVLESADSPLSDDYWVASVIVSFVESCPDQAVCFLVMML